MESVIKDLFSHVATYITHVQGLVVTNDKGSRAEHINKLDLDVGTIGNLRKENCVGLFTKFLAEKGWTPNNYPVILPCKLPYLSGSSVVHLKSQHS